MSVAGCEVRGTGCEVMVSGFVVRGARCGLHGSGLLVFKKQWKTASSYLCVSTKIRNKKGRLSFLVALMRAVSVLFRYSI